MKIKKICIKILCMPIFPRERRHKLRKILNTFSLRGLSVLWKFIYYKTRNNSVLLVEVNDCHGVSMPGFVDYFQKLDFNVDILTHEKIIDSKPFARCNMDKVNVFALNSFLLLCIIHIKRLLKYKHVVLMTSSWYDLAKDNKYPCVFDYIPTLKNHPSLFVIEHELSYIQEYNEQFFIDNKRLLTLGNFTQGTMVNPHYFGDIQITYKNKQTIFVTVGAIEGQRKNHKLLIDAIEELSKKDLDFKVVVVGRGSLSNFSDTVKRHIEIKGFLDYPEMYDEMENADFFLPLLDPKNKDHERYITTGITGSSLLIYGFAKPCLIHSKFADFYEFNNENAIIYESDFVKAMESAISMNHDEYNKKQNNLKHTAQDIYNKSLQNLKEITNV